MHIRDLNLGDAAELHTFYTAFRDAEQSESSERPIMPEQLLISHLTEPAGDEESHPFAAFDAVGGQMIGAAFLFYPLLDNVTKAYTGVFVAPQHRGAGVGGALADHVVSRTRADGRSVILAEATYGFDRRDDHPYRRFAERHGFALASTEVRRVLELPISDDEIDGWIAESAAHHDAYRIETFVDEMPEALLPSVCNVVNQLALDAPTGDIDMEAEQITPEIRRRHDARAKASGLTRYETVAIDPSGAAVAVTAIGLHADDPTKALQWATIVQMEHRGHRLGLAIKARNLRALQRGQRQVASISTSNEEHNGPMLDINERMGFKPVELIAEFQRKLAD